MPCIECGESAKEKHNGACFRLLYDDGGKARYYYLDCVISELKNDTDK